MSYLDPPSTIHLILFHEDKDAQRVVNSELEEFLGEERAKEANDALKKAMDTEDARDEAMEEMLDKIVKVATDKQLNKVKSVLRKNLRRPRKTMRLPTT